MNLATKIYLSILSLYCYTILHMWCGYGKIILCLSKQLLFLKSLQEFKETQNSEYNYIFYNIRLGHLIISNKSRGKNITVYISNSLNIEYYFQKICEWRQILKLFIIQMSITPKVFGLEKRNCTF